MFWALWDAASAKALFFFRIFILNLITNSYCANINLFITIYIIANVLKGEKSKRKNKNNKKVSHKNDQILRQQVKQKEGWKN